IRDWSVTGVQTCALPIFWPHMNVFKNAAFPLEVRRLPRKQVRERVMRVLSAVALDGLADRDATRLSGGQQQRLALARALVMEPRSEERRVGKEWGAARGG